VIEETGALSVTDRSHKRNKTKEEMKQRGLRHFLFFFYPALFLLGVRSQFPHRAEPQDLSANAAERLSPLTSRT